MTGGASFVGLTKKLTVCEPPAVKLVTTLAFSPPAREIILVKIGALVAEAP